MSTTVRFACPACHARYRDPRAASWVGRKMRCHKCGHVFVLEHVEVSENPAAAPPALPVPAAAASTPPVAPGPRTSPAPAGRKAFKLMAVLAVLGLVSAIVCGAWSPSQLLMWPLIFVVVGLIGTGAVILGLAVLGLPVWIIEKIRARSAGGFAGASGSSPAASRPPSTFMGRAKQAYAAILIVGLCLSALTGLYSRQKPYERISRKAPPVQVPSQPQPQVQNQNPQISPEDALRALLLLNAAAQQQQRPAPQQGYQSSYGYFPQGTPSQTPASPAAPARSKCSTCRGRGYGPFSCGMCNGTGHSSVGGNICNSCAGRGFQTCSVCGGTGHASY